MKQVVLSLKEDSDMRLRRLARITGDGRKGSLSKTVEEALILLEKKIVQKNALEKLKQFADEDINYGIGSFKREYAYER